MNDDKLTPKEKSEIAIQTGLQLVPYVGSALSTAYFATKQEKRFKRIESFYQELSDKLSSIETNLPAIYEHDEESLIALIERLNDEIEKESSNHKRQYFRNFFIRMLQTPTLANNYDERRMLLDSLASTTFFEFQVLLEHSTDHKEYAAFYPDVDPSVKAGAISRLEMLGLLRARYSSTTFVGQSPVKKHVYISGFGKKFIDFCLE